MLDICLLGTGGTVPIPDRWLTSLLVRYKGSSLLVDCGEGTQIALNKAGFSCRHIDTILLTHFHADHTAGLPGLLLSMAKADRTEPVRIFGPKGLPEILDGVQKIARYIPFEIHAYEYREREVSFSLDELKITAFHLDHRVPCYGYEFTLPRQPKFDVEKAKNNNVPVKCWSILQKGNTAEYEGVTYTPDMVLGENRRGLKMLYATDTRPTAGITEHAADADLCILEGMYGDPEKLEKALQNKHMMMQEAAEIAKEAGCRELWFTHYSTSMPHPEIWEEDIRGIFPHIVISSDGQKKTMKFED